MVRMYAQVVAVAGLAWGAGPAHAQEVDLAKIDRTIRREPVWESGEPLYCLFVVSPEKRVWFVIDGDDLHADLNGNGDLTDPGEKLPKVDPSSEELRTDFYYNLWKIPDLTGPDGVPVVKNIRMRRDVSLGTPPGGMWVSFEIPNGSKAGIRSTFADSPKGAPIVYPNGPVRLRAWTQRTGATDRFSVIGQFYVDGLGDGTRFSLDTFGLHCKIEFPLAGGKAEVREMPLLDDAGGALFVVNTASLPANVGDGNVKITVSIVRPGQRKVVPSEFVFEVKVADLQGDPYARPAPAASSDPKARTSPVVEAGETTLTWKGEDCVAFSPDGTRLASFSPDGIVTVRDTATGRETVALQGGNKPTWCLAFSADGKRVASASFAFVRGWDVASGREVFTREVFTTREAVTAGGLKTERKPTRLAFSGDGTRLAYGGLLGEVGVIDVASGKEAVAFKGHVRRLRGYYIHVAALAFSPDGKRLASASADGTVKVWDVASGEETVTLKRPARVVDWIDCVAFSPDGKRVAGGSQAHGVVSVWDVASGRELLTCPGHTRCVAFSPDGKRLAGSDGGAFVRVWDAASGEETFRLKGGMKEVKSVTFSPDGKRLATTGNDTVAVRDMADAMRRASTPVRIPRAAE